MIFQLRFVSDIQDEESEFGDTQSELGSEFGSDDDEIWLEEVTEPKEVFFLVLFAQM